MSDLSQGLDFARASAVFTADTRLYELEMPTGHAPLLVESWVGREALSALSEYHLTCLSTTATLPLQALLGQQLALHTRLADGSIGTRSGYVRAAFQLGADGAHGNLARYRLTLVPWLWFATQRRRSRVFQDRDVLEIVEQVFAADAARANWRVSAEAREFLARVRPRSYCCQYRESDYAFVTRLLAEEGIGFHFEETGADGPGVSRQQLVLFADSARFAEDASAARDGGIRFHRAAAVETADTIQTLHARRTLQAAVTTRASWDYKAKRVTAVSLPTAHQFGGPNAPHVESGDWAGVYAFATQDEALHYARIARDGADARFKDWFGAGGVRTFRPGTAFEVIGAPLEQRDAPAQAKRLALLGVLHAGVNNLPAALRQEVRQSLGAAPVPHADDDAGLPPAADDFHPGLDRHTQDLDDAERWLDHAAWEVLLREADGSGYANRFTAIRADIPWRPALSDGTGLLQNPRPTALGSQSAIVVGADGGTAAAGTVHTDHLGRVRIRYPWQITEQNGCWVRVAQLYAGPGYGAQFIPRIGQEVVVRFLDNDIDRPVVTGVLYNGRGRHDADAYAQASDHAPAAQENLAGGASPAWHGAAAAHRHAGYLSGFKSVALGADGHARQSNQLVFDDTSGRLRTMLASDSAATQLNLGHLIHQADNHRGSFRGTGWELRTDARGALRAGKGVLISTYHGSAPGGGPEPAGENSPGIALLKQAQGFADTFNRAAATHQTVQFILVKGGALNGGKRQSRLDDEAAPIAAMVKAISGLVDAQDGGVDGHGERIAHMHAPLVVVAAQAGIGVAAADGLHVAAGEVAHLAAGRDLHLATGDALSIHSGQALGLLAGAVGPGENDAGIALIAGQGDIDLQAQSDAMTLAAKDLLQLLSANSHIDLAAAKSITLATEGGASMTIADGNITFACPGTISIRAGSKKFVGPVKQNYVLPKFPRSICKRCKRSAAATGSPFSVLEE
ncbi:type VI secretion system tip protein VgrG [Noviherbaspirillum cavernae]|uniref:Type VI secretion system tip protein VgrG n=1 Tax=Noviherbaspirillum cavernae TaxID=2320862 RepID=A0A418X5B3_9BURK|nr:type VI secretion system Vgr family protein [Noviherbaspirillum cavernae]RJG07635.1 type VI secretion system tip protein VgrG [Noviherbaspirillum cavernae]